MPNFRDHGLMVDRPLLRLVGSLAKRDGYATVSEASLRAMIHQDTGHLPGVRTVPKALKRIEADGRLEATWIHRGEVGHNDKRAEVGYLQIRLVFRYERRAVASRAPKRDRRSRLVPPPPDFARKLAELLQGAPTHRGTRLDGRELAAEQSATAAAFLRRYAPRRSPSS